MRAVVCRGLVQSYTFQPENDAVLKGLATVWRNSNGVAQIQLVGLRANPADSHYSQDGVLVSSTQRAAGLDEETRIGDRMESALRGTVVDLTSDFVVLNRAAPVPPSSNRRRKAVAYVDNDVVEIVPLHGTTDCVPRTVSIGSAAYLGFTETGVLVRDVKAFEIRLIDWSGDIVWRHTTGDPSDRANLTGRSVSIESSAIACQIFDSGVRGVEWIDIDSGASVAKVMCLRDDVVEMRRGSIAVIAAKSLQIWRAGTKIREVACTMGVRSARTVGDCIVAVAADGRSVMTWTASADDPVVLSLPDNLTVVDSSLQTFGLDGVGIQLAENLGKHPGGHVIADSTLWLSDLASAWTGELELDLETTWTISRESLPAGQSRVHVRVPARTRDELVRSVDLAGFIAAHTHGIRFAGDVEEFGYDLTFDGEIVVSVELDASAQDAGIEEQLVLILEAMTKKVRAAESLAAPTGSALRFTLGELRFT